MKKKHIGGLALLIAGSACLHAGSVTAETASKADQGNYYGFTLALGTDTSALTDPDGILAGLSGESVSLDNVSILTRSNNSYADAKLAVYSFTADGTVGDFVGLSASTAFAPDTNAEFGFEGVNLVVGQRYQFLFVNTSATETLLTDLGAENVTLFNLYQTYASAWGIALTADMYGGTTLPGGWGTYKSSGLNSWEGHRMPVTSIKVSSPKIPEPGTFGAIAGGAALLFAVVGRRRRKSKSESNSREGELPQS